MRQFTVTALPLLSLVLSLASVPLIGAETPAFADLPTEQFVLADGRTLIGRYNDLIEQLWIGGAGGVRIAIKTSDIVSRKPWEPGKARAGNAAHSAAGSDAKPSSGAPVIAPETLLAVKRDEVEALRSRLRGLTQNINEETKKNAYLGKSVKDMTARYKELLEILDKLGTRHLLGYEGSTTYNLRKAQSEITQCVTSLEQSDTRLANMKGKEPEVSEQLAKAEADLAQLEQQRTAPVSSVTSTTVVTSGPHTETFPAAPQPDPNERRMQQLEAQFRTLQREHAELQRSYRDLQRQQQATPTPTAPTGAPTAPNNAPSIDSPFSPSPLVVVEEKRVAAR